MVRDQPVPMTQGVIRLASFVALLAMLAFALDAMIDTGLRRIGTSSFGVSNRIVDGAINADILITGSSRALSHYDAPLIQERTGRTTYNIGLNGSQTDMQVARLATYLRHNKAPALLIHNLDAFSFQVTHGGVYDPAQYMPYLSEPAIYAALALIDPDIWKSRVIPLYGYTAADLRFTWVLGALRLVGWSPAEDHVQGFKPRYTAWTEDFERFQRLNPKGVTFEVEPAGVTEMKKLLALCREHRIKVLLVYSPEYAPMQKMTSNRDEIFAGFDALKREFGVPLWDYSGSPISASRDNFYNSQHLNAGGAAEFSRDLAARLVAEQGVATSQPEPAN
ncbi:MAG: hypothetical protein AB7S70_09645 [Hyphomicrobium sp.]|uniref:hypothetical protein n=1 Tax=Hyphomicrobium sp. TaxID=82 RepID=UPI003D1141D7